MQWAEPRQTNLQPVNCHISQTDTDLSVRGKNHGLAHADRYCLVFTNFIVHVLIKLSAYIQSWFFRVKKNVATTKERKKLHKEFFNFNSNAFNIQLTMILYWALEFRKWRVIILSLTVVSWNLYSYNHYFSKWVSKKGKVT